MIGNLPLPQSPSLCTDPPIPPVKIYSLLRFLLRGGGGTVPRLLSPAKRLFATQYFEKCRDRTNGKDLVILPGVW